MIQLSEGRGKVLRWLAVPTGVILALAVGITPAHAAPTDPQTVVSLTFDDGNADQATSVPILDQAGMKGTFYITTGWIGTPGYLTLANLASMAADGQEIGGHTVNHPDLTALPTEEVTREVCDGRATLASWGFNAVTSFAYPFANVNAATEAVVKGCGFNSARGLGDIESRFGCPGCGFAETIPPADPYQTAALDEVDSTWTLADLETSVTNAETAGGGWVQFTFHHICDGVCDPTNGLSITPALLQEFTAWLALRAATNNTVVKTVGQVIGGTVQPVVGGTTPPPPAPGPGVNGIANPSLETAGTPSTVVLVQTPQCFSVGAFGTNTATFSTVSPGHTGNVAEQMNMTAYTDGDQKLLPSLDLGSCAPTVTPDHTYSLRVWYTATVPAQYDVYLRNTVGGWAY